MITPAVLELDAKAADDLARVLVMEIPSDLGDSLIGAPILGTSYFSTKEGDPTQGLCGYTLNERGKRIYKIEHQPTGSKVRYRKVNSVTNGECWEAISEGA